MLRYLTLAVAICSLGLSSSAAAAPILTPTQRCENIKLKAAGRYGLCRLFAEAKAVRTGAMPNYALCDASYDRAWTRAESVGAGICPSSGDHDSLVDFIELHTADVATALSGGTLPACPVDLLNCNGSLTDCNTALGTCDGNLASCGVDLASCNTSLTASQGNLATCGSSLGTCDANLGTCTTGLGTCNASLSTCNASLTQSQGDLGTCNTDLGACTGDLGTCSSGLGSCTADLGTCNGNLGTCDGNLGTCNANLGTCTGDLGACSSGLTTCNGNLGSCSAGLATCNSDLTACGADLTQSQADLAACGADLGSCSSGLGACNADLGACSASVTSCNSSLGTCNGSLTTCNATLAQSQADLAASQAEPRGQRLKTGQTACWNAAGVAIACAGSGQDGQFQKGLATQYADNGNGTVTDSRTGLTWEKLSDDGTIHDKDTAYNWSNAIATKIAALNSTSFGGHNDWRLPNVRELQSLANYGVVAPSTYPSFNTACAPACTVLTCSCTAMNYYWTSSTYVDDTPYAWVVSYYDGDMSAQAKTLAYAVRGVRGGS